MVAAYLYVNAMFYIVFAAWITLSPWKTATAVGYEALSQSGRSEYLVVYGGLQLGLALFFGISAGATAMHRTALLFSLCLYVPIVLYRLVTVAKFWPVKGLTLGTGALELLLLIAAAALYFSSERLGTA